ncbi:MULTISPECIES: hypothetical protein [Vibrio]|uniref:Uncharacterized protein n=1 Tax=Vibrio tasmaniensis TaxID=212663 RepID=A0AB38NL72_9VIBR|nr:hypothetical protein [Vibrio tasmaniensis]TKG29021.1 hypothetical protein FC057_20255 [Vibrio tasmaniensis]TKG41580.1 hypothetical protein FC063_06895 [Vibrio tasmaniensis]TKG46229.1 hypothetical protein FC070_22360 [Vibrio tasmaniensis]TKG50638.1 hypothetical protein FC060_05970 [Vibrio tasmaniensis]TKG56256.1 hypothetical protein FC061_02705 [Vibrio tasmaniensis]
MLGKAKLNQGFSYIEFLGNTVQVTIFDSSGLLAFDQYFTLEDINDAMSAFIEIEMSLQAVDYELMPVYLVDGNAVLNRFVYENADNSTVSDATKGLLSTANDGELKLDGNVISFGEAKLDFDAIHDEADNDPSENRPPATIKSHFAILTDLSINKTQDLYVDFGLFCRTNGAKYSVNRSIQTKFVYSLCVFAAFGAYQLFSFHQQQKIIAEQEALKANQVKIESPWRAYREEITKNKNFQLEYGLQRVSAILKGFNSANTNFNGRSLGWAIAEFEMSNNLIQLYPTSTGGTNQRLNEFSDRMKLRHWNSDKGTQIDALFQEMPINESVYLTSVTEEKNYIHDAMNWMFDDIKMSTSNSLVNGNGKGQYYVHLVKLEFNCWMAEDFLYASTQFAKRNYALHSVSAINPKFIKSEPVDPSTQESFGNEETYITSEAKGGCDFGYTGNILIKVFGSK